VDERTRQLVDWWTTEHAPSNAPVMEPIAKDRPSELALAADLVFQSRRHATDLSAAGFERNACMALACTPGIAQAEALLAIGELSRGGRIPPMDVERIARAPLMKVERVARTASMLAHAQPLDVVLELCARNASNAARFEVLLLIAHELVLAHRARLVDGPQQALFDEAARRSHPLARMPSMLRPIERAYGRPEYHLAYESRFASGLPGELAMTATHGARHANHADDCTIDVDRARIGEAARHVAAITGGTFETAVFTLDAPAPVDLVALAIDLPLAATRDASLVYSAPASAAAVMAKLFDIAAGGAEYNSGMGGGYGRLAAWCSLAGLVGLADTAPLDAIEAAAERSRLLWFKSDGPFYFQICNDLGILCVRPGERETAVLAMSTTD
jgi:hypothetical protein